MALFNDYQDFALHTMWEYLAMARRCIETRQEESADGCYGMAALLLLTSVMDTLGSFYPHKQYTPRTQDDIDNDNVGSVAGHFENFCARFISDDSAEIAAFHKNLYQQARCKAVHNSALTSGIKITNDANQPLFNSDYTMSNIVKLHDKVEKAFNIWVYDTYQSNDVAAQLQKHPPIPDTGTTLNNISVQKKS